MQTNQAQFVRAATQISHSANQRRIIREGSSVLVRIIADRGGGKYEASVAGNRLILTSGKPLETGSTFVGKIGLKSGQIIITRNGMEETLTLPELKTATFLESGGIFEKIISPELAGFLQALNLPSDNLSFHILLQFKQLGLRFDSTIMAQIRKIAEKSKNPKAVTEKLVLLDQKGIDINSPFVSSIIMDNLEDFGGTSQHQKQKNAYQPIDSTENKEKQDGESNESEEKPVEPIPYKLFNSLGFGKKHENENSWLFVPFEIANIAEKTIAGDGIAKLLVRTNDKSLVMMNVEINIENKTYRFLINLDRKKIKSVKYSIRTNAETSDTGETKKSDKNAPNGDAKQKTSEIEAEDKSITENLRKKFLETGNIIPVEWIPFDSLGGTASGLEEFSVAGGFA